MKNKEYKKEIISLIVFTVSLIFLFIYIKPIWIFFKSIIHLLMPFIIGIILAFVLNVLVNFIERKVFNKNKINNKYAHNISIIMSLAIVISFLTFIFILIIPQVTNTTDIFINNLPEYQENVKDILEKIGVNKEIRTNIIEQTKEFSDKATIYLKNNSDRVINYALGFATNIVSSIVNITIGIVFAIYLLVEKEKLIYGFNKLLKAYLSEKKVYKIRNIASLSNKTFANFVSGQVMEAIIIGILCFIGMLVLGIPYAATVSVLVGFTALIPVFGAFIGTFIGAFLIFMISPIKALIFVLFILILQQFEGNLIYPKVVGKSVNLPSIWVLVAVTIGASISGVTGMLLSVPIVSICYSILTTNVNERLAQKNKVIPQKIKTTKIASK